jgi:hypothetical protein
MNKDSRPESMDLIVKKAYVAPSLTVFGGLRDLTLAQLNLPMPADNKGVGEGGKLQSNV